MSNIAAPSRVPRSGLNLGSMMMQVANNPGSHAPRVPMSMPPPQPQPAVSSLPSHAPMQTSAPRMNPRMGMDALSSLNSVRPSMAPRMAMDMSTSMSQMPSGLSRNPREAMSMPPQPVPVSMMNSVRPSMAPRMAMDMSTASSMPMSQMPSGLSRNPREAMSVPQHGSRGGQSANRLNRMAREAMSVPVPTASSLPPPPAPPAAFPMPPSSGPPQPAYAHIAPRVAMQLPTGLESFGLDPFGINNSNSFEQQLDASSSSSMSFLSGEATQLVDDMRNTPDGLLYNSHLILLSELRTRRDAKVAMDQVEEDVRSLIRQIEDSGAEEYLSSTKQELQDLLDMCRLGVASAGQVESAVERGLERMRLLQEHEQREASVGYTGYMVEERAEKLQQALQLRLRGIITTSEHELRLQEIENEVAQLEADAQQRELQRTAATDNFSSDTSFGEDTNDVSVRHMRVFISSTFRDMGAEREVIMKEVIPRIQRELCEPRGIELTAVDLRWGITSEQSGAGDTVSICLSEVDRCRPYFVGLLGCRYGWALPASGRDDLLERTLDRAAREYAWIHGRRQASVTELEIRHAVLNNPTDTALANSMFFFKTPTAGEPTDDDTRLTSLKAEIVGAGCRVVPYTTASNAAVMGKELERHLRHVITTRFPDARLPNKELMESTAHRSFGRQRSLHYVGGERSCKMVMRALQARVGRAAGVAGAPGFGKSALMAHFAAWYRSATPRALVIEHYTAATGESTSIGNMLRRICMEIKSKYSMDPDIRCADIPTTVMGLIERLPWWIGEASRLGPLLLVLDGLDELDDSDDAHSLRWLPAAVPPNVFVVVSTQNGSPTYCVLEERKTTFVRLRGLPREDRVSLARRYLGLYHKSLNASQMTRVVDHGPSTCPLYLRILLEELRQFGNFEALDSKIDECLKAADITSLLSHVLRRVETDVGSANVQQAMRMLCTARRGLTEEELRQCMSTKTTQQDVSRLLLPLRPFLADRGGYLTPFHNAIRDVVQIQYLTTPARLRETQGALVQYFQSSASLGRRCEELPYHLWMMGEWKKLKQACFNDATVLLHLFQSSRFDLYTYFRSCRDNEADTKAVLIEVVCASAQRQTTGNGNLQQAMEIINAGGKVFEENSAFAEAEKLYREGLRLSEEAARLNTNDVVASTNIALCCDRLGYLFRIQGRYEDAVTFLRRALDMRQAPTPTTTTAAGATTSGVASPQLSSTDGTDTARDLASATNALAMCYRKMGRYGDAEPLYQRALALRMKHLGSMHPDVGQSYNSLACLNQDKGNFDVAEDFYRRALEIREGNYGPRHPDVAMTLFNLGMLLTVTGRYAEARPLMERSLAAYEATYGSVHGDVAQVLNGLAGVHMEMGSYELAEGLYRKALNMRREIYGTFHPDVALSLNDLAVLYTRTRDEITARSMYREALDVRLTVLGQIHPDTAQSMNNLAFVLSSLGEYAEAEELLRTAESVITQVYNDPEHPDLAQTLNNLAALMQRQGRGYQEIAAVYDRVTRILERRYPDLHPDIAMTLNNRAVLAVVHGLHDEAKRLYHRAVDVYVKVFGPVHPEVGTAYKNLSDYYGLIGDAAASAKYLEEAYTAGYK